MLNNVLISPSPAAIETVGTDGQTIANFPKRPLPSLYVYLSSPKSQTVGASSQPFSSLFLFMMHYVMTALDRPYFPMNIHCLKWHGTAVSSASLF